MDPRPGRGRHGPGLRARHRSSASWPAGAAAGGSTRSCRRCSWSPRRCRTSGSALLLIMYLSLQTTAWLPNDFNYDQGLTPGLHLAFIRNVLWHAILPGMATILITSIGGWILTMRNNMITTLAEDYVRMGRAKGLLQPQDHVPGTQRATRSCPTCRASRCPSASSSRHDPRRVRLQLPRPRLPLLRGDGQRRLPAAAGAVPARDRSRCSSPSCSATSRPSGSTPAPGRRGDPMTCTARQHAPDHRARWSAAPAGPARRRWRRPRMVGHPAQPQGHGRPASCSCCSASWRVPRAVHHDPPPQRHRLVPAETAPSRPAPTGSAPPASARTSTPRWSTAPAVAGHRPRGRPRPRPSCRSSSASRRPTSAAGPTTCCRCSPTCSWSCRRSRC